MDLEGQANELPGLSALAAVTRCLNSTPVEGLPRISGFLASSLTPNAVESAFPSGGGGKNDSTSVGGHKLKVRINSLLQDRSTAGRFTATILIKSVVDKGAASGALSHAEPWARSLVSALNKPDPVEVKRLYLITITRIFLLTQDYPHLLRELTTPLLPPFITACLNLIKPIKVQRDGHVGSVSSPLLAAVLRCWLRLLPQHASVFRPFLGRIRPVCLSLMGDESSPESARDLATQLVTALLACSPKNTATADWSQVVGSVIRTAHETTNTLFRIVKEDYDSVEPSHQTGGLLHDYSKQVSFNPADDAGLGPWHGVVQGSCRLSTLLGWLRNLATSGTLQAVAVPMSLLFDLVSRILAVTAPERTSEKTYSRMLHRDAGQEEKDELWMKLPEIHVSCLKLLLSLTMKFQAGISAVVRTVANQVLHTFQAECWHENMRNATYRLFTFLLPLAGNHGLELESKVITVLIGECCKDLKREHPGFLLEAKRNKVAGVGQGAVLAPLEVNRPAGSEPKSKDTERSTPFSDVYRAAWELLPELLASSETHTIPRQIRAEMDRLAVLLVHKDAMLASVMNPFISGNNTAITPSLLPFLVKSAKSGDAIEALLRPRMPVTQSGARGSFGLQASQSQPKDAEENGLADEQNPSSTPQRAGSDTPHENSDEPVPQTGMAADAIMNSLPEHASRKRQLEAGGIRIEEEISADAQASREPKRLRPDNEYEAQEPEGAMAETLDVQLEVAQYDQKESMALEATEFSVSGFQEADTDHVPPKIPALSSNADVLDDEDSDDSGIPQIDTGFDTDEEDEEQ